MSGGKRMRKPAPKAIAKATKKPARKLKASAKAAEPAMDLAVGRRIRELRRARQLSLETVVARTDLSIGFVSQIERGLSSPSLRVLATLADVLGVGIAALFGATPSDDASGGVVTRQKQRAELKLWRTGISKQLLSPADTENRLNLFLVHLEPGGSTGDELYTHYGEEAGLRARRRDDADRPDAETWSLKTGDSFRFASRRPHRFSNPADDAKAVVLWVNCVRSSLSPGERRDPVHQWQLFCDHACRSFQQHKPRSMGPGSRPGRRKFILATHCARGLQVILPPSKSRGRRECRMRATTRGLMRIGSEEVRA